MKSGFTLALLAAGAVAGATATTAAAQTPVEPTTITASGSASAAVRRPAKPSDGTISKAVEDARIASGPRAVINARQQAELLAGALGLRLGALQAVTEGTGFPFGPYGINGTFGPGRFCGTTRRRIFRLTADGRRVATGRIRARYGCRIPASVTTSVSVTFLATAS